MKRLGIEMVYNYIEILPCIDIGAVDDVIKDDNMTYRSATDNTKGDRTIRNHDKLYEIVENYKKLNCLYIYDTNIRDSIINNVCRPKIRLLFDDGG